MLAIPPPLSRKLYVSGSLTTTGDGFGLSLQNTLAPGTIIAVLPLIVDGRETSLDAICIGRNQASRPASRISPAAPFPFGLGDTANIWVSGIPLEPGPHSLLVTVRTKEVGDLQISVEDQVS